MRRVRFSLSLVLFALILPGNCPAGWTIVPTGSTATFRGVAFPDSLNGWVVGLGGTVRHTTDGGLTWSGQSVGSTTATLTTVSFADPLHGIIGANGGSRYWTANGGANWNVVGGYLFSGSTASSMVDDVHGWLAGSALDLDLFSPVPRVERTTDGGAVWDTWTIFSDSSSCVDVQFIDADLGYMTKVPLPSIFYRSTNGGEGWTPRYTDTTHILTKFDFLDAGTGFLLGTLPDGSAPVFMKTTNSGSSWSSEALPNPLAKTDIDFTDELNGWVIGRSGNILHTTDGGTTWTPEVSHTLSELNAIRFTSPTNGWVVGASGIVLHYQPDAVTGVGDPPLPQTTALLQNYPNPFNPAATIRYTIAARGRVVLTVSDLLGREVAVLVDEMEGPGEYEARFDGAGSPSGVYLVRLHSGSFNDSRKLVLLR